MILLPCLGSQELSNAMSILDFFAIMDREREHQLKWFAQNVLGNDCNYV
jgi:hypothetical protein